MLEPRYQSDRVTLYCGDCLDILPHLSGVDAVVTDPPYGISYSSGMTGHNGGVSLPGIAGDDDTSIRDGILAWGGFSAGVIFGSRKRALPEGCRAILVWEKGDHVGMGDLSIPWKPNTEEIYIIGVGFHGHRGSSVIRHSAPVSWNSVEHGRRHPHEKPVGLLEELIRKTVGETVADPCMGGGSTGIAALRQGRKFIGIEIDEGYYAIAERRIRAEESQGKFAFVEGESHANG